MSRQLSLAEIVDADSRLTLYTTVLDPITFDPTSCPYNSSQLIEFLIQTANTAQSIATFPGGIAAHPWWVKFTQDKLKVINKLSNTIDIQQVLLRNLLCMRTTMVHGRLPDTGEVEQVKSMNFRALNEMFGEKDFPGKSAEVGTRIMISIARGCENISKTMIGYAPIHPKRGLSAMAMADLQVVGLLLAYFDCFHGAVGQTSLGRRVMGDIGTEYRGLIVDRSQMLYTYSNCPEFPIPE